MSRKWIKVCLVLFTLSIITRPALVEGSLVSGSVEKAATLYEDMGYFYTPLFSRAFDIYKGFGDFTLEAAEVVRSALHDTGVILLDSALESFEDTGEAWGGVSYALDDTINSATEVLGNKIANGVVAVINSPLEGSTSSETGGMSNLASIGSLWNSFIDKISTALMPLFYTETSLPATRYSPQGLPAQAGENPDQNSSFEGGARPRAEDVVSRPIQTIIQRISTPGLSREEYLQALGDLRIEMLTLNANTRSFAGEAAAHAAGNSSYSVYTALSGNTGGTTDAGALTGLLAIANGGTGTTTAPVYGQLLLGNALGGYTLTATSSLGLTTSAGGSDTQVQFNNAGIFGGSSLMTFNSTIGKLTISYASTTALTTSGSAYFATSGGNIGIGTTTPQTLLSLQANDPIISLYDSTASGKQYQIRNGVFGNGVFDIYDKTNETYRFQIDNSGRASLGTTTISEARLFIAGDTSNGANVDIRSVDALLPATLEVQADDFNSSFQSAYLQYNGSSAPGSIAGISRADLGLLAFQEATNAMIYTSNSAPLIFATNATERLRIGATGNVGIGIASPTAYLDVAPSGVDNVSLKIRRDGFSRGLALTASDSSRGYGASIIGESIPLYISSGNTSNLILQQEGGNVGIGTTNPFAGQLHVDKATAGGLGGDLWLTNSGTNTVGNYSRIAFGNDATTDSTPNGGIENIITNTTTKTSDFLFKLWNGSGYATRAILTSGGKFGLNTDTFAGAGGQAYQMQVNGTGISSADADGGTLLLHSTTDPTSGADVGAALVFGGYYTGTTEGSWARIRGPKLNSTAGNYSGSLAFDTRTSGSGFTEKMRITNDGNVGIGTTNPGKKLSVNNDSAATYAEIVSGTSHAGLFYQTPTRTWHTFSEQGTGRFGIKDETAGEDRLSINTSGNVGIGTTNPQYPLDLLYGAMRSGKYYDDDSNFYADLNSGAVVGGDWSFASGDINIQANKGLRSNGALNLVSDSDDSGDDTIIFKNGGGVESMRINTSGNVGIGTTTPYAALTVNGAYGGTTAYSLGGIDIKADKGGYSGINFYTKDGVYQNSFLVSASPGLSGMFDGNNWLWNSNASAFNIVQGSINVQNGNVRATEGSKTIYLRGEGIGSLPGLQITDSNPMTFSTNNTERFRISATGGISIGDGTWNATNPGAGNITVQGNVGIGTTSPYAKLSVVGDAVFSRGDSESGLTRTLTIGGAIADDSPSNAAVIDFKNYDLAASGADFTGARIALYTPSGAPNAGELRFSTAANLTTLSTAMTINRLGNVGIGETNPSEKLTVSGNILASNLNAQGTGDANVAANSYTSGNPQFILRQDGGDKVFLRWNRGTGTFGINMLNGPTDALNIKTDGSVGIGTTTPGAKLVVASDTSGIWLSPDVAGAGYAGIGFTPTINGGNYALLGTTQDTFLNVADGGNIHFRDGNSDNVVIDGSGRMGIGTASPTQGKLVISQSTNQKGIYVGSNVAYTAPALSLVGYSDNSTDGYGGLLIGDGGSTNLTITRDGGTNYFHIKTPSSLILQNNASSANSLATVDIGAGQPVGGASKMYLVPYAASQKGFVIEGKLAQSASYFDINTNGNTGGDIFTVLSSGNVGIGTTTSSAKLSVNAPSGFTGTIMDLLLDGTSKLSVAYDGSILNSTANNNTVLQAASFRLNTNGSSGSGAGLRVNSNTNDIMAEIGYNQLTLNQTLAFTGGSGFAVPAAADTSVARAAAGKIYIGNATGGDYSGTLIASNVGIGTTTPWGKLSVTNSGSGPSFIVEDDTSPDSTPFVIDATGNVGIGTASPFAGYKLQVVGTASIKNGGEGATISGGGGAGLIYADYDGVSEIPLKLGTWAHKSDNQLVLATNGFVGINMADPSVALDVTGSIEYTGDITDVSDERLKDNITDFESGLAILERIGVKNYNMKNTPGKDETGFIAQNVKDIFPQAVSIVDPTHGYMGVSYMSFIPVITKAIQELKHMFDPILAWFVGGKFHVQSDICVDDVCVTKDQFKQMLLNSGSVTTYGPPEQSEEVEPPAGEAGQGGSEEDETASSTDDGSDSSLEGGGGTPPEDVVPSEEETSLPPQTEDSPQGENSEPEPTPEPIPSPETESVVQ